MILLIESRIGRRCRHRCAGIGIATDMPVPSRSSIIRNYMSMLFVYDSTSLLQTRNGYEAILIQQIPEHKIHLPRMSVLLGHGAQRARRPQENYNLLYLLCSYREGAERTNTNRMNHCGAAQCTHPTDWRGGSGEGDKREGNERESVCYLYAQ